MIRSLLAATVFLASLLPAGARAGRGLHPADCFIGNDDIRFARWSAQVGEACRLARAQVEARIGLTAPANPPVRCVVATREARRLPYDDWRYATTTTLADGSIEVFFAAEAVASGAVRFPETAIHEMTHALMRARMGESYHAVDPWFREGLAVWVAGQGEDRLNTAIARAAIAARGALPRPEALLDGLLGVVGEPHDAEDYAEDYLALRWLEAHRGGEAVGAAVRKVIAGAAPLAALADASGVAADRVPARVDDFARARIARVLKGLKATRLKSCGRALDRGQAAEAAACFDRFVERRPGSPLEAVARMLGAISLQRSDHPVPARKHLAWVAASGTPFADEALQRITAGLDAEGRPRAAFDSACGALRNGFTRHAPHLSFLAGRSLMRLDQPEEAIPWLERINLRYPSSAYADSAVRLVAEARRRIRRGSSTGEGPGELRAPDADGGGARPPSLPPSGGRDPEP